MNCIYGNQLVFQKVLSYIVDVEEGSLRLFIYHKVNFFLWTIILLLENIISK
jgi:hypothetical protein